MLWYHGNILLFVQCGTQCKELYFWDNQKITVLIIARKIICILKIILLAVN